MPTIDEMIVRLDADLQPLESSLRQATARIRNFATTAERDLRRVEQRAAAISRPSPSASAPSVPAKAAGAVLRRALSDGAPKAGRRA